MRTSSPPIQVLASLALILSSAGAYGCVPDVHDASSASFQVRDSAGVQIVESTRPQLTGEDPWLVGPDPELQIGELEGREAHQFTQVFDAARAPDGRIAVSEGQTFEIRVFSREGAHLGTFGGAGDGPAEFGAPPFLAVAPPDTLLVWDPVHFRLSRFALDGSLLEQETLAPPMEALGIMRFRGGLVWQLGPGGTLLSTGPAGRPARGEGLRERQNRFVLIGAGGEHVHDFGPQAASQSFWVETERGGRGVSNPYAPAVMAALGPEPHPVAIGGSGPWQVTLLRRDGVVARIVRAAIPRAQVTSELLDEERAGLGELAEGLGITLSQAEDAFARLPLPDSIPAVGAMGWDSEGRLWVGRRVGRWWEAGDYDVFGADGRWLTTVSMPPGIERIHEWGDDYMLASATDELDVPYLRVYRIRRPI